MARTLLSFITILTILASYALAIVGGHDVSEEEEPYVAQIKYKGNLVCAGAIINKYNILTAAQCVEFGSAADYSVALGTFRRSDEGQQFLVKRIIEHEGYDSDPSGQFLNNIAMLLLSTPVEYSDTIRPIPLPHLQESTPGQLVASGWGFTKPDSSPADILQKLQTPSVPCFAHVGPGTILPGHICYGFLGEEGRGSCQGDGGGPLRAVSGGYLAGIIHNTSNSCGRGGNLDVATEVSLFVDWIKVHENFQEEGQEAELR